MDSNKVTKVGIGFATGRKSFQKVMKTYVYNWFESGLTKDDNVQLDIFVAYDLKYHNTKKEDYTKISEEVKKLIDDTYFIGKIELENEMKYLINQKVIDETEAKLIFGSGYAAKRNAVLYFAIKNKVDYLLFLDDDEYPVAVTKTRSTAIWGGQQVLLTHLNNIKDADITNGHHCGYISPIPFVTFNDILTEADFSVFIEAISNDIINWESIRTIMNNGGVTYADTKILVTDTVEEVEEVNHSKFISGANLCINLTKPERVFPFYNPPGARGEDTFLSTCLHQHKVMRVPCYAFHDGFSTYNHLMEGVLPTKLKFVEADSNEIIDRFYRACIGWIRYKPLLIYITNRDNYDDKIEEMRKSLTATLPNICNYFKTNEFMKVLKELDNYDKDVKKHYDQFMETQRIWSKIIQFMK